jgi:phage shock protein C
MKRLYRSKINRVFSGVCGGLGDYLNVDPVVLRLVWVILTFFSSVVPGIVAYFIATLIIPLENSTIKEATASEVK